jgi:hypothetical protein
MVRTALAVAVILALASSGANAQEAQPPGAAPSETQQPGGPAPEMQPGGPPSEAQPGGPPPGAQGPGAQGPGGQAPRGRAFRAACRRDVAQFCSQLHAGKGRLWRCVKQHFPQLSPSCKQLIIQARQSRAQ